jgi:transcriptional regulator with XRE-family HTH domain
MDGSSAKSINQRTKEVRLALKMSKSDFAKAIFISRSYVGEMEMERRALNDRIIRLISLTFGISEKWLKTGEGGMFDRATESKRERIERLFDGLNPDLQDFVLAQINHLLKLQAKRVV